MSVEVSRKLTTILAADVEGYCRLMAADEADTLARLMDCRALLSALITRHGGRIANTAGDGMIAEFASVVEAVQCAIEIQSELDARNGGVASERAMRLRVGIHLGDVMTDGGDLFGEGVNLAARLEQMAGPGDVFISQPVYDQIHRKLRVDYDFMGLKQAHNLPEPVAVYRVRSGGRMASLPPPASVAPCTPPPAMPKERPLPMETVRRVAIYAGTVAAALAAIDIATEGKPWWPYPAIIAVAAVAVTAVRSLVRDSATRTAAQAGTVVATLLALKTVADALN
ncbi:MAG: adenylate/guanylate cyclase domain-containing protein [Devosia sp.]